MRKLKLLFTACLLLVGALGAKAQFENEIPSTGWSAVASSYNGEGPVGNMFDGNTGTYWHSEYNNAGNGVYNLPQWFVITLPEAKYITGFAIQRRNDNANCPKKYKMYVSNSDFGLTAPATTNELRDAAKSISADLLAGEGELPSAYSTSNTLQQVELNTPRCGKYILFVIDGTYNSTKYTCVSEFKLYDNGETVKSTLEAKVTESQAIFNLTPEGTTFGCIPADAPERTRASEALSTAQTALEGDNLDAIGLAINELDAAMDALQKATVGYGERYLFRCVSNSCYAIYNSGCVKSASDPTVILSNWVDYDRRSFFMLKVAEIAGDGTIYYTISSAVAPTQYVYAVNTGDEDSNVGVKEITAGTAIPDNAKWQLNARGAGWNIIPKNGSNGWNCRGSYNNNNHIGQWDNNGENDNIWTIQTTEEHIIATQVTAYADSEGKIGGIASIEQSTNEAKAVAATLVADFTDANFTPYHNYVAKLQTPASGLYKIQNKAYSKWLFSEQTSNNAKNLTLGNNTATDEKYYWNVTFNGNQATIIGATGLSMAKGGASQGYAGATTDYISPVTLQFAPNSDIWTENYFVLTNVHINTGYTYAYNNENPIFLTTWSTTNSANQYTFEPVTLPVGTNVYTVEISGVAPQKAIVTYKNTEYGGNTEVYDGGFYVLSTTEAVATNFSATEMTGRSYTVTIDGNYIRVHYSVAESGAKLYRPGARATTETLTTGKKYFIYNTCYWEGQNRSGFLRNDGGTKVAVKQVWPSTVSTLSEAYLFELEGTGEAGKYYIKSSATGKYVNSTGDPSNVAGEALSISEYSTSEKKSDGTVKSYSEDEEQTFEDVTADSHVWTIGTGTGYTWWNGNSGSFASWDAGHPYAFYEVTEVAYSGEFDEVENDLKNVMAKTGVGYPTQDARNTLTHAIQDGINKSIKTDELTTAYNNAINTYKSSTDVNMPEDGKAYTITSVFKNGTMRYMNYAESGYTSETVSGSLPETAILICRKVADGKYAFVNTAGKYFMWKGNDTGQNGHKGYADTYDATNENSNTVLTVKKLTAGDAVTGTQDALFGYVAMQGNRNDGNTLNYFVLKTAGGYDQADKPYYNDNHSSALLIEEVADPRTTVNVASALPDDGRFVATYSTPFPTVVPTGVKAYAVIQASATMAGTQLLADEGEKIPANEGVLLVSETSTTLTPVMMKPATRERNRTENLINPNMLVGTGINGTTVDTDTNAYILANGSHGIGFYKLKSDERTIGSYRAYLVVPSTAAGSRLTINFGDIETGIDNINGTENTNGSAVMYDLSGRRVQKPVKGSMYIKNGVKYIHQ